MIVYYIRMLHVIVIVFLEICPYKKNDHFTRRPLMSRLSELLQTQLPLLTKETRESIDSLAFELPISAVGWAIKRLLDVQSDSGIVLDDDAMKIAIALRSCKDLNALLLCWVSLYRSRLSFPLVEYELMQSMVEQSVGTILTTEGFVLMAQTFSKRNIVLGMENRLPSPRRVASPPLRQIYY